MSNFALPQQSSSQVRLFQPNINYLSFKIMAYTGINFNGMEGQINRNTFINEKIKQTTHSALINQFNTV